MLIDEQQQRVRYVKIYWEDEIIGFLATKGSNLSRNHLEIVASMLGIFMTSLQNPYAILTPSVLN